MSQAGPAVQNTHTGQWLLLSEAVQRFHGASERTIRRRIESKELVGEKVNGKWWVKVPSEIPTALLGEPGTIPVLRRQPPMPAHLTDMVGSAEDQVGVPAARSADRSADPAKSAKPARPPAESRDGRRGDRRDARDTEEPDPNDQLHADFGVGRLVAWRKLRTLRSRLVDEKAKAIADEAAAILLEGYLAFGSHKIDCYRHCRGILCRLATILGDDKDDACRVAANEALGSIHALIITLHKKRSRDGDGSH